MSVHDDPSFSLNPAIASAISAGLGAVTLRNKLTRLNEVEMDEVMALGGKVAKGVGGIASRVGEEGWRGIKGVGKAIAKGYEATPDEAKPVIAAGGALAGAAAIRKARDLHSRLRGDGGY